MVGYVAYCPCGLDITVVGLLGFVSWLFGHLPIEGMCCLIRHVLVVVVQVLELPVHQVNKEDGVSPLPALPAISAVKVLGG